jgi:hypothetical protein
MRVHVNDHLDAGFVPTSQWLAEVGGQLCSGCSRAVTCAKRPRCLGCRGQRSEAQVPRNEFLPSLRLNHVVQVSLGASEEAMNGLLVLMLVLE